jgi:UTP--glucose-1-phosphate uridylyltransferase
MPSDSKEFHELTKKDALCQMQRELDKLVETAPNDKKASFSEEMRSCTSLFGRFLQETGPSVFWDKIEKLPEGAVMNYANLQSPSSNDEIRSMLNKLVVVKLNGGLGTSMGCSGPKSVIPVRNDLTFLDLTVQQIEVREFDTIFMFAFYFFQFPQDF